MRASKHVAGCLLLSGALLVSSAALAEPQLFTPATTLGKPQVYAGGSYGSDHLSAGVTARAGYTLPIGLYVGGLADYFFESTNLSAPGGTGKGSAWDLGAEAGYDFGLRGAFVLRPYAGVGNAHGSTSFCPITGGACTEDSGNELFFQLGGMASYVGPWFLAGVDFRMLAAGETVGIVGGHLGLVF